MALDCASVGARLCIVHRWAQQACVAYTQSKDSFSERSFCHDTSNSLATSPNVTKNSYLVLDMKANQSYPLQGATAILYERQSSLQKTAHTLHHTISCTAPLNRCARGSPFRFAITVFWQTEMISRRLNFTIALMRMHLITLSFF